MLIVVVVAQWSTPGGTFTILMLFLREVPITLAGNLLSSAFLMAYAFLAVMPVAPYLIDSPGSVATDDDTGATITPAILEAFEKRLEKWHSDESSAKIIIC